MFKIESYVAPILLSYVDKYVRDFKPADAQLSLWGGGVALHNLVLKADVLQQELALPFTLVSGRIHELLIQVPWTKIMSEPIVVTIDTIECVLSLNPPAPPDGSASQEASSSRKTQEEEAPPGYMQALVRRVVSNIRLRVHHLIVKYVQDDVVMSLNVKHLAVDSAGPNWEPAFADIEQSNPVIRRLVRLDDLTLCLDKADADGKIRFYQEPLLYRCQLDLKVLTRLVSANSRRISSMSVQLRSTKLAWSVTNEQVLLLLRLIQESPIKKVNMPPPKKIPPQFDTLQLPSSTTSETNRSESWSEWAWSFLPAWNEPGVVEEPATPAPLPIYFNAYLDEVSLVFKVMEVELARKRARGVLELVFKYMAVKGSMCSPTMLRVQLGIRDVTMLSNGKCVCGYVDYDTAHSGGTAVYLKRILSEQTVTEWQWPEDVNNIDIQQEVDEANDNVATEPESESKVTLEEEKVDIKKTEEANTSEASNPKKEPPDWWDEMSPVVFIDYTHDRSPPDKLTNPYENPPRDFEYSDWVEVCSLKVKIEPMQFSVCMGLLHRLGALYAPFTEQVEIIAELPKRTLTVEEWDALLGNLPQRRIHVGFRKLLLRILPYEHRNSHKLVPVSAVLDMHSSKISVDIIRPLYPYRVCSAACQMPDNTGKVCENGQMHVTTTVEGAKVSISSLTNGESRPCARAEIHFVYHKLLHPELRIEEIDCNLCSYFLTFKELNICGSLARLQVAVNIPLSLFKQRACPTLKHTTLFDDALNDEGAVAIDITLEELHGRYHVTPNVSSVLISIQSARAMAFHEPQGGTLKQAWLFSAPETPSSRPYCRMVAQYCVIPMAHSIDYLGMWSEPTAASLDPLLISWLAYKPAIKSTGGESSVLTTASIKSNASLGASYMRRTSSSGRKTGSGSELVHMRSRSQASSSEPSERKTSRVVPTPEKPKQECWWEGERLQTLHDRLRGLLLNIELGKFILYVTTTSPSALDCATIIDSMERHAENHPVLVMNLGRLQINSQVSKRHLWQELRCNAPTFFATPPNMESFPWKLHLADISCYTLELPPKPYTELRGITSRLRPKYPTPQIVLELVATNVTLSVVTKNIQYKTLAMQPPPQPSEPVPEVSHTIQPKAKFFSLGMDFKPSSLKEFVRGPKNGAHSESPVPGPKSESPVYTSKSPDIEEYVYKPGPRISFGVHIHADTSPIIITMQKTQLHLITSALHGMQHLFTLLYRKTYSAPKANLRTPRSLIRSVSEMEITHRHSSEDTDDHASGSLPDMNMIFDRSEPQPPKLRTYFCVQWVLSYVSMVVSSNSVKLASKIDDIICTIDMQPHYNQIKVKVSSAYVKYYEMKDEEWVPGPLGGRVLEAKEPTNTKKDNNFFTVTVTQAEITELPSSWKEELHPKVLEQIEVIWEVYVKLAPLEAVLHPQVIKSIAKFNSEIAMNAFCSLETVNTPSVEATVWPFFYLSGGGLRLLVTGKDHKNDGSDDTFIFTMGKVNVNPHPENPICRRSITAENNWSTPESGYEGRQYEANFKTISLHSANLNELIQEENGDAYLPGTTGENPAFKWSQKDSYASSSSLTPILHPVDVCCVYAPPLVTGQSLKCGPAFEFNLVSDCFIEFSPELITLMLNVAQEFIASTSVIDFYKIRRRMAGDTDDLVCPYPSIVMENESKEVDQPCDEQAASAAQAAFDVGCSNMCDSGVETIGSASSIKTELPKKKVSVSFIQDIDDPSDYLEVFVTMGVVELSLYVADSDDPQVVVLRPHDSVKPETIQKPKAQPKYEVTRSPSKEEHLSSNEKTSYVSASRSLSENVRDADMAAIKLETIPAQARRFEGNIPLVHFSMCQPNLYYSRRKTQQTLQLSLFNVWVGLGLGPQDPRWHQVLLTTAKGEVDLHTDIAPALATMKLTVPYSNNRYLGSSTSGSPRGSLQLDVERPVQAQVCAERLKRIKAIASLLTKRIRTATYQPVASTSTETDDPSPTTPMLYNFRKRLLSDGIETVTIILGQISVYGAEGTVGWESVTLAISTGQRPDRIAVRCLVTALVIGAGPEGSERHILLMPVTMGGIIQARWEAWRRAEGGPYALEPSVRVCLDLDSVVFDIRPTDMAAAYRIRDTVLQLLEEEKDDKDIPPSTSTSSTSTGPQSSDQPCDFDYSDNYYKDDLRSGAFKLESGDQIPMAYQVVMGDSTIAWRYPHPRAITRVIAFPLPDQEKEIECVLELYSATLNTWSPHTYFCIPVGEPCELQLEGEPPETVFCSTWRFRVCAESEPRHQQFVFSINQFRPIPNPTGREYEDARRKPACHVPAEQLLGALRVDSYFAPRLYPPRRVTVRVSEFDVYLQNSICYVTSDTAVLEGYYVTKTTQRSHRVLCLSARNSCLHLNYGTPVGMLFVADTNLSVDILDSATGAMEQMFHEFRVQATVACGDEARTRLISTGIHIGLNLCRLHTLHSLWTDWKRTSQQISVHQELNSETKMVSEVGVPLAEVTQKVSSMLEGRISLWIHNNCTVSLRVGQEGTDEIVTLAPGSRLAYRWRSPTAAKKLRLGMASPSQEWIWSTGIPFVPGSCRMRLGDAQLLSKNAPGSGVFMHVKIEQIGTKRFMYLVGRLVVANMLRYNLFYKVRDNMTETQSSMVCSEELKPESVGKSVLCSSESEMLLRIKLADYDIGWSGDIPLKECPKENVPWLVKVPSDGDAPFISVWCRVSRARTDGRILACFWPLYLLYSYLPLDTDALIRTVPGESDPEPLPNLPPLVQTTPGRGSSTQIFPPGTTHARHTISLRYRNVDCPVTPDVIPFHYGVTESSVFNRQVTINDIEDVIKELYEWLNRSRRDAPNDWPYSVVTKHWPGQWEAALLQPRSDVIVQYGPVIAGGGCSLELRLCPAVLLCNAAPIPLTLRAHDAAPLCKLEPGHATSPPKIILTNTFYISIEIGRETFVSSELQVSEVEPGRYGAAPAGHIILEHPTEFSVMCHQKVALLSMYYEINDEINILGVTTTYVLINRLKTDILVAPITYYQDSEDDALLKPKAYDVIHPSRSESTGTPVCQFWLHGRWRSDDASQLRSYLCLALPDGDLPAHQPVPVQLGDTVRRAVALIDANGTSVPVVVSQMRHEGRKVVVVASDPCPQFLVYNHTMLPLYVAQPVDCIDNSSTSNTLGMTECSGARWWCYVPAGRAVHYSTPSHCARYPPPPVPSTVQSVPFLTFAKDKEIGDPIWCPPVAAADGEQLLQLHNVTIKMRVRTHPHSTLIELQDFDTDDISASDIRRRLLGSFKNPEQSPTNLERTKAENELFAEDDDYDSPLIEEDTEEPRAAKVNWPSEQALPSVDKKQPEESTMLLYDSGASIEEKFSHNYINRVSEKSSYLLDDVNTDLDKPDQDWAGERARCVVAGVVIEMAARADTLPLIAVHLDRTSVLMLSDKKSIKMLVSVADVQVDNLQYESGQFDFSVVASTRSEPLQQDRWPPLWNMFYERDTFATRQEDAKLLLKLQYDKWRVVGIKYTELTEVELRVGTLALFIEDAYVTALVEMSRIAMPSGSQTEASLAEERMLQNPLRLRKLLIHPLDLTLTLHTAVRMYIALDQSPLRLSAFELQDMMTSSERLTHALTMHYLSAAILGAGWVVGGLELLGAPGALAARVGGATGGVRGVASAAAAALLRSLSAWAGSLARNLDILAGDEEHAQRAAAARRRPPPSFVAGLVAGITNFAINMLGAVGGLAHHPLVGVAVGETESGAAALRRGIIGALTKPLSATADLVAYAGTGLLRQTGWDPVLQPRRPSLTIEKRTRNRWRRDCVRWMFRLSELNAVAGFEVLADNVAFHMLLTHKCIILADRDTERILKMIDYRYCSLGAYQGQIIELRLTPRNIRSKVTEIKTDDDEGYFVSAAAMARVARYTSAQGADMGEGRVIHLLPAPYRSHELYAILLAVLHNYHESHFTLL